MNAVDCSPSAISDAERRMYAAAGVPDPLVVIAATALIAALTEPQPPALRAEIASLLRATADELEAPGQTPLAH